MKNVDFKDPNNILNYIKNLENEVAKPQFELNRREDIQIKLRVDETIAPAKFKQDPLIPGGFLANSLTLKALRSDIFVLGETTDDLSSIQDCACGKEIDVQFWKFCPYCSCQFDI